MTINSWAAITWGCAWLLGLMGSTCEGQTLSENFQAALIWLKRGTVTAEARRDTIRLPSTTCTLLKPGTSTEGCSVPCPVGIWGSPGQKTPHPLWETCFSVWLPSLQKGYFFYVIGISCLSVHPVASCPLTGQHWKDAGSAGSFTTFLLVFTHTDKISLSLPSSQLNNSSCLSLSLYDTCSALGHLSLTELAPLCACLSSAGEPRTGHSTH